MLRTFLVCLIGAAPVLVACRDERPRPVFDSAAAFQYVEQQLAFGPRVPGTDGHRAMAAWLDSALRARADTVVVQAWTHVSRSGDSVPMRNFLARFNPAAQERILFVAHWDTRPRADGPNSRDSTLPVPGANDGGSGVAILLGVADALKQNPPEVGVDLLFVDGEDYGEFNSPGTDVLIGARYYAEHQPPGPQPRYAVVFDLVGDQNLQLPQEGNSLIGAPRVVDLVWSTARELGYEEYFIPRPGQTITDDHLPLQQAGIPAIDVIDLDYPAWHTPDDTIEQISEQSLDIVGTVALALVRQAGQ